MVVSGVCLHHRGDDGENKGGKEEDIMLRLMVAIKSGGGDGDD